MNFGFVISERYYVMKKNVKRKINEIKKGQSVQYSLGMGILGMQINYKNEEKYYFN